MKAIARPVNPHYEYLSDETSDAQRETTYHLWLGWEQCQRAMDEYYREALQDSIGLLMSAEGELIAQLDWRTGNLHQALIFIRNAKDGIVKAVNEKEG